MTIRVVLQILCASVLASTAMVTTPAQTPEPTGPPSQAPTQRGTDPEFEQRQRDLRLVDKLMGAHEATKTATRRDPKVVAAELQEDFTRIQVVNNDLAEAASSSAPLNLEFVVKSTAELVEHSKRLGKNLGHPEPEKGSKPPKLEPVTDVEQLRRALGTLNSLITEFIHNPLFTEANTRNAELFVKARRDLAEIIALSEHIKKNAEELSKAVSTSLL
ncbi:MAG TPA: hypothetical protein VLQ90_07655 [Pyrinomonadaceae bacterium]|nr:hypothetical protein [Pyrinomonadaceae bacterium]